MSENNYQQGGVRPDKRGFWKKRGRIFKTIFVLISIFLIAILSGLGYVYFQSKSIINEFSAGDKKEVVDKARTELNKDPLNEFPGLKNVKTYLLLGYDVRTAIKPDDPGRTDTILLVRVYPKTNSASILSLPRDLYIPIPGYGDDRINAAYTYGGVPLLVETLREWLGVKIDHFVQIGFVSFIDLVNDINGAYIPVDQRYYNDGSNGYMAIDLLPGYQRLKGEDALTFVRFRSGDSDFYRASRQQIFIREVGRSLRDKTTSIDDYKRLIEIISKQTTSDLQSLPQLLNLANTLRNIPSENIVRTSMGGSPASIRGMSVIVPSESEKEQALYDWDNPEKFIKQQEKSKPFKLSGLVNLELLQFSRVLGNMQMNKIGKRSAISQKLLIAKLNKKRSRKASKESIDQETSLVSALSPVSSSSSPLNYCVPEKIPGEFYWPSDSIHEYKLNKKPALAAYITAGSGRSALFMWTGWQKPPILNKPSDSLQIPGDKRIYKLYWESGQVRMIAWRDGKTISWITNTLQNELDKKTMIALATNCK
jgi:LCP family protein required for cell wall assembly